MKNKLPLNPNVEIFRWGPAPGKFYYESEFVDAIFYKFPILYKGFSWPITLFLFNDNRLLWVNEYPALRKAGTEIFVKHMLPKASRKKLRTQWERVLKKLSLLERKLESKELAKLTDDQLFELGKEFYNLLIDFWIPTIPQELGNYGSDNFLESKLLDFIPKVQERAKVMQILTAPEKLSFYQLEELALSKSKNISSHQKKYFWLHNSYNGTKVLPVNFFQERKLKLSPNLNKRLNKHLKEVKIAKLKIQKQYGLPKYVMNIAEALSYGVTWQDERKKNIFLYLHYKELFLKEVAKRKGYNVSALRNISTWELVECIKKDTTGLLKRRANNFGFYCKTNKVEELGVNESLKYWKLFSEELVKRNTKQVKGIIASTTDNLVKGKVKIIYDPFKVRGFKNGDVLVAPMTTPEYVFLMKKASAIITDAGGLTSHAAIVSRELRKPCIVGTKTATKVFKDGDMVEVDANKGTVRKL